MKIGRQGKITILEQVRFHLDQEKSGVPRDGIEHMLTYWIVGLLESAEDDKLKAILEE